MTFIIAEVGSNYRTFEEAKDSITMAKEVGADAVKYQMYSAKEMFGVGTSSKLSLDPEWLPKLHEKAESMDIELMCTAFSPEGMKLIDPYVKRHKIASSDLPYVSLLETAKEIGKITYLSVGGASITDMSLAFDILEGTPMVPLYCLSNYPSSNVNLFSLDHLSRQFDRLFGYSCHTSDWYTAVSAVRHHGAVVVEKHFKLKDMNTPDSQHSLLPSDFKKMVDAVRGKISFAFPDPQEKEFVLRHKRRLMATVDIKEGETLHYGLNYGCFRSFEEDSEGLSGFAGQALNGKIAKRDILSATPITPDSFV